MSPRKAADAAEPAPPALAPSAPPHAKAWVPVDEQGRGVRAGLLTIAIVMLGAGCVVALYAAMRIASIWFEDRFVPIVQLAVGGVAIGLGILAVRRLNRKP